MLHGCRHITYDGQGYIYWKNQHIEHFNQPTGPEMAEQTIELDRRCKILETRKQPINTTTVVWQWDESGKNNKWEIAFDECRASKQAQAASRRICEAYRIKGLCDPAYIANVIETELNNAGQPYDH